MLMKPVFAVLRGMGYTVTSFIDATLLCHQSQAGSIACIKDNIVLLQKLGFCFNSKISVLVPTQCIECLGNIINKISMTVSLPECRGFKIVTACRFLINKSHARIRKVARVIGLLVAAFRAVELGKLPSRH